MACFKIKNLSFFYPDCEKSALTDINLTIDEGEFVVLCGKSGCGKSTLLRHLKPILTPHGSKNGEIFFGDILIENISLREQAAKIGFVLQNPDNQIVTDKVWHELAFGLESLGEKKESIRIRVAEMASFFGLTDWFNKEVCDLSGGQKQLLNLASVMVCQPDVLILDEPTSQLDPIAASDFFNTLRKINMELGTTIILSEHRLEDVLPLADRVVVLDEGKLLVCDTPMNACKFLAKTNNDMFAAMPAPIRISYNIKPNGRIAITVREGRKFLFDLLHGQTLSSHNFSEESDEEHFKIKKENIAISLKDVWFRYEKSGDDIVKDLSLEIQKGTIHAIVGANGAGKTTALSIIAGINKPYRGVIAINGINIKKISSKELYHENMVVLPQNPTSLFTFKTAQLDLLDMLEGYNLTEQQKQEKINEVAKLLKIDGLLAQHPFDLSGGEQQRLALAKILLTNPKIILLDEPTKGLDQPFKEELSLVFNKLKAHGITIVIVSHDIEFLAKHSDFCSMFFNGNVLTTMKSKAFFAHNSFYTTAANRMARNFFTDAVTDEEVVFLCQKEIKKQQ